MSGPRGPRVEVVARAKLNLFLEVIGKRADGYHEVETVLQEIDLEDDLALESLPDGPPRVELKVQGDATVPAGVGNTAHTAATLFLERFAPRAAVSIEIVKRIPSGAGLGGGSSDAAAALRGLARLLRVDAKPAELDAIAAKVGSDVPFFLAGGVAIARGRGERIERLPAMPRPYFVVVAPPFPCSTGAVYGALTNSLTAERRTPTILLDSLRSSAWIEFGRVLFNRLVEPAFLVEPRLRELRDRLALAASPFPVSMTGSGSAIYAVTETAAEASRLGARLSAPFQARGCRVIVARGRSGEERC